MPGKKPTVVAYMSQINNPGVNVAKLGGQNAWALGPGDGELRGGRGHGALHPLPEERDSLLRPPRGGVPDVPCDACEIGRRGWLVDRGGRMGRGLGVG